MNYSDYLEMINTIPETEGIEYRPAFRWPTANVEEYHRHFLRNRACVNHTRIARDVNEKRINRWER